MIVEVAVARCEVVLLVEERVVRDVHLAIHAEQRAIGVDDCRRVAVDPRRLALEDGHDDDHLQLAGEALHGLDGGTGDRFGEIEPVALL